MNFLRSQSLRTACRRRLLTTPAAPAAGDVRDQLKTSLKTAMKSKDAVASLTIRSILSEVYAADKSDSTGKIASNGIVSILRKAKLRRTDSAAQFIAASRPELAAKEQQENEVLEKFIPPTLPVEDIDAHLRSVLKELGPDTAQKSRQGLVLKSFYQQVDRSMVDALVVNNRVAALLAET